jgi:hypothetical protein
MDKGCDKQVYSLAQVAEIAAIRGTIVLGAAIFGIALFGTTGCLGLPLPVICDAT